MTNSKPLKIRALPNQAIVKCLPFRHHGMMEIPGWHEPPSVEAEVISDGGGNDVEQLAPGVVVFVSRMVGEYFQFTGEKLCRVPRSALMMKQL